MPLFPPQDYRKTAFTHRVGTAAARPAAADVLPGTLYYSTDTGALERSTGAAWAAFSGLGTTGILPVPNGGTGQSSLATNGILIGANLAPIANYANFTYDGTLLLIGGQIQFPAAQAASANANTLDDYEEGTWTPVITFGGGSTGITYTTQTGYYIKIGRFVALTGLITLSNKGSSAGSCVITGLPFSMGVVGSDYNGPKVSYSAFTAGVQEVGIQSIPGSATMNVVKSVAGVNTITTDADFTNTSTLIPGIFYQVA
jgi:hypothetical protein